MCRKQGKQLATSVFVHPRSAMLNILVRLITPKLYLIYSWNFTDGLIISRPCVFNKKDNSGYFSFCIVLPLPKIHAENLCQTRNS